MGSFLASFHGTFQNLFQQLYGASAGLPNVDLRVLMHGVKPWLPVLPPAQSSKTLQGVDKILFGKLEPSVKEGFLASFQDAHQLLPETESLSAGLPEQVLETSDVLSDASFDELALGGDEKSRSIRR